ncbi:hypothetical protein TRIP_D310257 [uncultured Paludibacter sp.]|uniref:Uncharacterized protein n=1 Tax=uncultured Paludibacter sp. TaxID=497635 RepID=A0A653ACR4_9BACT|nr:hypothetical protein TRIP_D310257 [uncultured Paludibacter sp.]
MFKKTTILIKNDFFVKFSQKNFEKKKTHIIFAIVNKQINFS